MKQIGIIRAMLLCRAYEKMDPLQKQEVQKRRLRELVNHARENSPYYRELYKDVPEEFALSDLPPTDKRRLMENWDRWICDRNLTLAGAEEFMKDLSNIGGKWKKKYLLFTTSGSTGTPLVAVYDKTANNIMGAIAACRSYARQEDLKAFLKRGGKSVGVFADGGFYLGNSSIRSRLKSMPWKKKQLAVSSALYPMETIVEQLNAFQPDMLGGYPSHLELLMEEAREGRLNISPAIIMTGGEYLPEKLRWELAETFRCYVQTSYSCTEGGTVACECRRQHFHINEDWILLEAVDAEGDPVPEGVQSDKVLLTNLYNYTQPYIRYEVTDRVIFHREPCGCGNPAPWIELEGRTDDVAVLEQNGKPVRVPPLPIYAVLKEVPGLRRFQLLVRPGNDLELRMEEKDGEDREQVFGEAKERLEAYLKTQGVTQLTLTLSGELPRQDPGSGKFKHIVNRSVSVPGRSCQG